MPFWKSKSARPKIGDLIWHLRGDGDGLIIERLHRPMPGHIAYIKAHESKAYRETHLRLMKPVRGTLSPACMKALLAFDIADAAYRAAYETFHDANSVCDGALQAKLKAVKAYGIGGKVKSGKYMAMHHAVEAEHAALVASHEATLALKKARLAREVCRTALEPHIPEIVALHATECGPDCPLVRRQAES